MVKTRAELHEAIDIVLAEYLAQNPGAYPSKVSVSELLDWHQHKVAMVSKMPEARPPAPIPMILHCPACHARHVDEGEFAEKPHHSHACQSPGCGHVWRPALVPTVGVIALPGFLNDCLPRSIAKNAVLLCTSSGWTAHRLRHVEVHAEDAVALIVSWKVGGGPFDDVDGATAAYLAAVVEEGKSP